MSIPPLFNEKSCKIYLSFWRRYRFWVNQKADSTINRKVPLQFQIRNAHKKQCIKMRTWSCSEQQVVEGWKTRASASRMTIESKECYITIALKLSGVVRSFGNFMYYLFLLTFHCYYWWYFAAILYEGAYFPINSITPGWGDRQIDFFPWNFLWPYSWC